MHPEDLAELRDRARLGPCEGIECEARHLETNKRETLMQLRPLLAPPARAEGEARERLEEVRRAIGGARPLPGVRQMGSTPPAYPACTHADFEVPVPPPAPPAAVGEGRWVGTPPRAGKLEALRRSAADGGERAR